MPSSDSDDFESADEGRNSPNKKERKKRLSSSNYSDNVETDLDNKKNLTPVSTSKKVEESTDGWDDFDVDEGDQVSSDITSDKDSNTSKVTNEMKKTHNDSSKKSKINVVKSQDTGWNDFDDWGDDDAASANVKQDQTAKPQQQQKNIQDVTERLATASTKSDSWGWGWGVDSILSSATAGISTLTSQVSQGISTVLETSIGAPDPEELARKSSRDLEIKPKRQESLPKNTNNDYVEKEEPQSNASDAPFPFGSLISGVTKFVETTGTKVLAGGLDTLETIGKKTMEVLQDGDPGLAKKRALLGLDAEKPVLSQVLREAKAKADEEDRIKEEKREAKQVHYESLFDDFEGLVHLEALEMLSRQVSMRIDERIRAVEPSKRQDIKETLQQVAELCEMPEEDDEDEEESPDISKPDAFHERLKASTRDIGLKMQYQPLIKQYTEALDWLSSKDNLTERAIYKRAVSSLAEATALSVELYHKTAEMLLVKQRRSTADEADALTQMTTILTKHIGDIAMLFIEHLNSIASEDKERVGNHVTNIFLEAENSSKYIQNAFQLALPIIQIGAV